MNQAKCQQHPVFPGSLPSKCWPGSVLLNYSEGLPHHYKTAYWQVSLHEKNVNAQLYRDGLPYTWIIMQGPQPKKRSRLLESSPRPCRCKAGTLTIQPLALPKSIDQPRQVKLIEELPYFVYFIPLEVHSDLQHSLWSTDWFLGPWRQLARKRKISHYKIY